MIIFFTYTQHTFFIIFKIKIYLLSLQFLGTLITISSLYSKYVHAQNSISFCFYKTLFYIHINNTPNSLLCITIYHPTHNLGLIGVVVIFFVVILPLFEKNPTGTLGSFLLILCAL